MEGDEHRPIALVANLGASGPPNGQVVKARAVLALLRDLGQVEVIEVRKSLAAPRELIRTVRRGDPLIVVLNRKGLWLVLTVVRMLRWTTRRRGAVIVTVVGGWLPRLAKRWWYRLALRVADELLVESERLASSLCALGMRSTRFPNFRGMQIQPGLVRTVPSSPVRLCCAGRVRRDKGVLEAAAVARTLNERGTPTTLDIYGPVEDEDLLKELEEFDEVHYCGIYESSRAIEVLARYDFLVLASRYEGECMPGVVVEACFAALPAIVSGWQDLPEVVVDGVTGFVIPLDGFVEQAADRIQSCLAADGLRALSEASLDMATTAFTEEKAAETLRDVIARHRRE